MTIVVRAASSGRHARVESRARAWCGIGLAGGGGWVRRGEEEGRSVHEEPISVVWVSGLVVGPEIPLTKFGRREANGLALCAVNRTFGKVWHGYTDLLALRRATAEHF